MEKVEKGESVPSQGIGFVASGWRAKLKKEKASLVWDEL
jgi:hypothetical protein